MKNKIHAVTVIFISIVFMVITFNTENPIILISQLGFFLSLFLLERKGEVITKDFKLFIPFFIITSLINIIFSAEGNVVLLKVFNKSITAEALIYGFIFSFKLLIIIMSFSFMGIFIDSDRALSYFSSKIPKSAFMLLISFKLFPTMKNYLQNLKEIYIMRGVSLEEKKIKDRIKGFIPIVTVMLENSMEKAFDLGEAAYVRGFFSGKRSCYEKQKFTKYDYVIIITAMAMLIIFLY